MKCILVIALTTVVVGSASAAGKCFNLTSEEGRLPFNDRCYMSPLVLMSKVTVKESDCGGYFDEGDFVKVPSVKWRDAEKNSEYTFMITDKLNDFNWAVSNIPGSAFLGNGNITGYNQLMEYKPTFAPTMYFSYDAYIFLQTKKVPKERLPLFPMEFVKKHELCGPTAATMWVVEKNPP